MAWRLRDTCVLIRRRFVAHGECFLRFRQSMAESCQCPVATRTTALAETSNGMGDPLSLMPFRFPFVRFLMCRLERRCVYAEDVVYYVGISI